jgi:DNA-binding NtrC family response regulator
MEDRRFLAIDDRGQFIARSAAMREVVNLASRIARLEHPVLIQGEPGVGKTSLARYIHSLSGRCRGPLVRVACESLHEHEVEEKLFGQAGGRRAMDEGGPPSLLEASHRGTLLLEGVSHLPMWAQTKLLDVLQQSDGDGRPDRQAVFPDVRLIASTTCDLEAAAAHNRFQPELYYYLNVVRIHVPPLRHRQEDIGALAEHFLAVAGSSRERPVSSMPWRFSKQACECLLRYDWPGNVPQLASVVSRAVMLADDTEIGAECIGQSLGQPHQGHGCETISIPLAGGLKAMELAIIREVIRRCRGNKAATARVLGLHRRTLYRLLEARSSADEEAQTALTISSV